MTVKVTYEKVCDRCKEEFNDYHWEWRIGKLKYVFHKRSWIGELSWMRLQNGSGSQDSRMSLDLCSECAHLFTNFMKGK